MNTQYLIAFCCYFSILLLIGILSHKKQKTSQEFIVGNRSLNFWLTALSAHSSDMSNWLFMGYPAAILLGGLSQSWIAISLILGMWLNWQFVAKKLRTDTEKYQSYTLSSYFENRLDDKSGLIRVITAFMTIFFLTFYLATGLMGMGFLFESVFGIDYYLGLTIALFVIVSYTFYGGYITVAWTDLFQGLFLLFFILLVPTIAYSMLPDGIGSIEQAATLANVKLKLIKDLNPEFFIDTIFLMAWGLGYWGQPHILTKFMGIKNANEMKKAKYVGMTWMITTLTAATAIGLIGIAYFQGADLNNPELIFIEMVKSLFHPVIAGFVLCSILAATMSTMDSQILVCASVLSEDFYNHIVRRTPTEKEKVLVSRLGILVIALIALMIAFQRSSTVLEAVNYAWSGLGSTFGPLLLMCLYSTKVTRIAGLTGIIIGGVMAACWHWINPYMTDVTVPAMLPAFFLSLGSIMLVTRIPTTRKNLS